MASAVGKEATLNEVLAEVSVLDVGRVLKQSLTFIGCFGVLLLVGFVFESGASYAMPNLHVPTWLIWFLILWGWLASVTEHKSYHEWTFDWYFPTLRWWASLLLAAYIVGGFELYWVMAAAAKGEMQRIAVVAVIYP